MTTEEKAKAYDKAINQAKKELQTCGSMDCDAARQIFRFFPELTESEDERIRKWLITSVKDNMADCWFDGDTITREMVLAWLEKQKESLHIPESCKENEDSFTDEDERIWDEMIKYLQELLEGHQGVTTSGTVKEWILWLKKHKPLDKDLLKEFNKGLEQAFMWGREGYEISPNNKIRALNQDEIDEVLEKQKEQKPTDYDEELKKCKANPLYFYDKYVKVKLKEQKPAEWNQDEFTENVRRLITDKLTVTTKGSDGSTLSSTVFIDDKTAKDIANGILFYVGKEAQKNPDRDVPEWSEEDEKMIERLIRHTQKEFDELCNDRYGHQEIISDLKESCRERMRWLNTRLKSLRPQPHWKPTKAMLDALNWARSEFHPDCIDTMDNLTYLYKELKQLYYDGN